MKRRFLALACVLGAAGWVASTAAACHSEITASLNCSGLVSYTATAWTGPDATTVSRTNNDVRISVSYDNGHTYAQVGSGHFWSDNGFSFSGSFSAGNATSVIVAVREAAKWGNGDSPADARTVTVSRPGNCSTSTPPPVQHVAPAAPVAPAPPASISIVKLERIGTTGDFLGGPIAAKVGDTISYQIVVTNTGPAAMVTLADPSCSGLSPTGTLALESGKSLSYSCSHIVVAADGSSWVNTATATATAANGIPVTASSSVTANVTVAAVLGTSATIKHSAKAKHVKVKKVTKRAKPARAQVRAASFTG